MASSKRTSSGRKPCKANQVRSSVTHRCRMPVAVARKKAAARAKSYYRKNKSAIKKKAKSTRRKRGPAKKRRASA